MDFQERQKEKQASRDRDEELVRSGQATWEDIERKNAFLTPERTIVHWERAKSF